MTELIQTSREDVVAFRVKGTVTEEDVERVASAIDHALEHRPEVSLLADLDGFEDMSLGGLFADLSAGLERASAVTRFERVGVIGDQDWLSGFEAIASALPGVEVKAFDPDRTIEAHAWVAGLLHE